MAKGRLQHAFTNATYEFLGKWHHDLANATRRECPHVDGPEFAAAVLSRLLPEVAHEVKHDPTRYFERWLEKHEGEWPSPEFAHEEKKDNMKIVDLRRFGLALLGALRGCALVRWLTRNGNASSSLPATEPRTYEPPKPRPIRVAVVAFSGKVRDVGKSAERAGELLTKAPYWWSGTTDGWDALARTASLSTASGVPASDDELLVVVYEAPGTTDGPPSSRTEGASRMRDAARTGDLRVVGTFGIGDAARLNAAGFRR